MVYICAPLFLQNGEKRITVSGHLKDRPIKMVISEKETIKKGAVKDSKWDFEKGGEFGMMPKRTAP